VRGRQQGAGNPRGRGEQGALIRDFRRQFQDYGDVTSREVLRVFSGDMHGRRAEWLVRHAGR